MSTEELTAEEQAALDDMQAEHSDDTPKEVKAEPDQLAAEEKADPEVEPKAEQGGERETKGESQEGPEFKSSREKPPEGFVPHAAMHSERQRRQELEKRLADLEAKLTPQEEEKEPEWADPLENPEQHRRWEEYRYSRLEKQFAEDRKQRAEVAQRNQILNTAASLEAEFAQKQPDYEEAAKFVHDARVNDLRQMGKTDAEISKEIQANAFQIYQAARSIGMNPAELLYLRAQQMGYTRAEAAPAAESEAEKIIKLAEAQKATQGLGTAGGGKQQGQITAEQLANMSEEELAKVSDDDIRRVMGG